MHQANLRFKMGKGCRWATHQGPIRGPQTESRALTQWKALPIQSGQDYRIFRKLLPSEQVINHCVFPFLLLEHAANRINLPRPISRMLIRNILRVWEGVGYINKDA